MGRILGKMDQSQSGKAEEHILKGIKVLDKLRLRPIRSMGHLHLGLVYLDVDRREEALMNLKKAEFMFQEMGMDRWLARVQELLKSLSTNKDFSSQ